MLIGILQTGHIPEALQGDFGSYPDMFERLLAGRGLTFRTWSVVDMDFPGDIHDADGWLITGSRHGAYEDHPFIPPLEAFIRKAYDAAVPMVGICFGHQIIAQALGGKVEKFAKGWAVGATDYRFGDEVYRLNAWHQDQVTAVPPGAEVISSTEFCENAAFIYGDRAFSVQPHPEIESGYMQGLMDKRGKGLVPEPLLAQAAAKLTAPTDNARMADRIAAFFTMDRTADLKQARAS